MKIAIIGGGFGLYGYLPALIESCRAQIVLPDRYRERILVRDDVKRFEPLIQWAHDDEALLGDCQGVLIALPPALQPEWVEKSLRYPQISHLLLEKPVAVTPSLATELIDRLRSAKKQFRIGYNFRCTEWGKALLASTSGVQSVEWRFRAHHYAKDVETWKRRHEEGGGALRFYGIHLIALLAELGYDDVISSEIVAARKGEADSWHAEVTGPDLTPCTVTVSSDDDDTCFVVKDDHGGIISLSQPFETHQPKGLMDQRIPFLEQVLFSLLFEEKLCYDWYQRANDLWGRIEQRTTAA